VLGALDRGDAVAANHHTAALLASYFDTLFALIVGYGNFRIMEAFIPVARSDAVIELAYSHSLIKARAERR
jgi:hypothetical protein